MMVSLGRQIQKELAGEYEETLVGQTKSLHDSKARHTVTASSAAPERSQRRCVLVGGTAVCTLVVAGDH